MFPRALHSNRSTLALAAASIAAAAAVGCTTVLGMPAPTCLGSGCPDDEAAGIDPKEAGAGPAKDAAPVEEPPAKDMDAAEAGVATDAPPDTGAPTDPLRCGGGDLGDASFCAAPNPLCCMRPEDDGGAQYACTTESDCSSSNDYPIACAGPQDCATGFVCCHFRTSTTCVVEFEPDGGPGHCLDGQHGGSVVCNRSSPDLCPPGSTCSIPLDNSGVYYACSQ